MSSAALAINPRGIFDRSSVGRSLSPVAVQVERGRLRFFAEVLGETDPIHVDSEAARAAGHPDIVALPSFFTVILAIANEERRRRGEPSSSQLIGSDHRYLLHGGEDYKYTGLVFAGDEVTVTTAVAGFYDRKGGAMEFATLEFTAVHATRGKLIQATRTLIHRLP